MWNCQDLNALSGITGETDIFEKLKYLPKLHMKSTVSFSNYIPPHVAYTKRNKCIRLPKDQLNDKPDIMLNKICQTYNCIYYSFNIDLKSKKTK